eukprot:CAMPEP_0198144144 /NCGR_PEP_ID=MMETSP1443-20131203/13542_1 /TAXON_ID=186043 /ORGANISM="Entomoneis sp., Strain CCMP2396" /LENGTH=267 /DNA_ID=CAMNT_0043807495 /DNA_START=77 /DNA_END=880 /DNA_ORIENTATION=-
MGFKTTLLFFPSIILGARYGSAFQANQPHLAFLSVPTIAAKPGVTGSSKQRQEPTTILRTATSDDSGAAVQTVKVTEWIKPRNHNSSPFRGLALLTALAGAGAASRSFLPANIAATVHILSFGTWFGSVTYTTFIAGLTMFKNLPRKMFGTLQSKLFPKYFALCSATLVLQLLTLPSLGLPQSRSMRTLGVGLAFTLLNQLYLEPKSTSIMFERYRLDDIPGGQDTDEYKKLRAEFGKLHGMSSLTNLIALCTGVAHAVFLASGIVN